MHPLQAQEHARRNVVRAHSRARARTCAHVRNNARARLPRVEGTGRGTWDRKDCEIIKIFVINYSSFTVKTCQTICYEKVCKF